MFLIIVIAVVLALLGFGALYDWRRRRRGLSAWTDDGERPGAHGAYADGLHEGIRSNVENHPFGGGGPLGP